jgi:hypothetical protein
MQTMVLQQQQPRQAKQVRWREGALLWGVLQVSVGGICDDEGVFGYGRCGGMRGSGGELSFSRGFSTL